MLPTVRLDSLASDQCFMMPWRMEPNTVDDPKHKDFRPYAGIATHGRLLSVSSGSCRVRLPNIDGSGWDYSNISPGTEVVPASEEEFMAQRMSPEVAGPRAQRERSTTEKPVQVVFRIASEMYGAHDGPLDTDFRRAVIAACVAAGVNPNTAKTQYYHWKKQA